jgi:ABC-type methionine transport system ATPase subunit
MSKQQVRFTFNEEVVAEPIIYSLGQQFNIMTNIRQAELAEDRGWIVLEIEGKDKDIEAGIAWAISKGVRVDLVNG